MLFTALRCFVGSCGVRVRRGAQAALLPIVLLGAVACRSAGSLPTVSLTFTAPTGKVSPSFLMEVAATPAARSKGLMFRRSVAANEGMIFLFNDERRQSFWMKNTIIPLDMVFVSSDWKVVGILSDVPPLTENPRFVEAPSQYVLEFAAGTAAGLELVTGAKVSIIGGLPGIE